MNSKLLLLIVAVGLAICAYATDTRSFDYDSAWKEIEQLYIDNQSKSMEIKVDSLYNIAVMENMVDQQIKALICKLIVQQRIGEFSPQVAIKMVQDKLDTASQPAAAILHSILAQLYWNYYHNYSKQLSQRNRTIEFKQDNIATWDLDSTVKETIKQYNMSLQQPLILQKYNITDFPAFLVKGGIEERLARPNLYDFLAHRALDYFLNDESGLTLPTEEFSMTDTKYFLPAAGFVKMQICSPDTLSLKYQALVLYQDLIRFHINDLDPTALIEVDLDRLNFVYLNCNLPQPEEYYESSITLYQSRYSAYPASALASYRLAMLYYNLAGKYKPTESENYRWHYLKAAQICQDTERTYPLSYGGKSCSSLLREIVIPSLSVVMEQSVMPQTPNKVLVSVKNLNTVKLSIYKIPYPSLIAKENPEEYWQKNGREKVKALMGEVPYWSNSYPITIEDDYRVHTYELPITALPFGNYILIAAYDGSHARDYNIMNGFCLFNCSELSYLYPNLADKTMLIANRNTGLPIEGVSVSFYNLKNIEGINQYQLYSSGTSNADGIIKYYYKYDSKVIRVSISSMTDTLQIFNINPQEDQVQKKPYPRCQLFTDRAIYRPGQTIYVKGIYYESDGEKHYKLLPNKDVYAVLMDANGQKKAELTLKTNDYATFNCTFTVPEGTLTGNMRIYAGYSSVSFSVEEYKRPKFEVNLDKPKETYSLNQYVAIKGKALAYSGLPIDGATVSYRVSRQTKYLYWYWWWGANPDSPAKEISNGKVVTDAKGEFWLSFLATADESVLPRYSPYFTYSVSVDVTDINGETRSSMLSINIGEKELILKPELDEYINLQRERLSIPIKAINLSNEPIAVKGTVTIKQLRAPENIQKKRLWDAPDRDYLERSEYLRLFPNDLYGKEGGINTWQVMGAIYSGSFDTAVLAPLEIDSLSSWKPGAYLLEVTTTYKQQEVKVSKYFTVYDKSSFNLPYPIADWFIPIKTICEPGEMAEILIGSSYTDVSVLYDVEKNHVVVESKRITLNDSQNMICIPVVETDRGSFYVHFTFIRDGRLYTHSQEITVPWTNKQLSFEYMSFRNKLLPGQEEEWRLKLKDHTDGRVIADVLASMYDASLDAFRNGQWSASVYGKVARSCGWVNRAYSRTTSLSMVTSPKNNSSYPQKKYDSLNWYYYNIGVGRYRKIGYDQVNNGRGGSVKEYEIVDLLGVRLGTRSTVSKQTEVINIRDDLHISSSEDKVPSSTPVPENSSDNENLSSVQPRTNFAETAFFYPELRTDENGELSFVFNVPETLTRWKFRAMALTKDFQIGTTENTTVTQKPLMVTPNAPRFFREGDKITFTAKISSMDELDQSGSCRLYLFDAITMQPVDSSFGLVNALQQFMVKKGESKVFSWDLSIPYDISAVTYRVVAKAGNFSDGEENTLPILSNRMLVTESLPLPVSANSKKSFVFTKLAKSGGSGSIKNHKLTLEFTSNPAWYAVQALPYMMEYPYECNEQTFSRFYANSLASHIANSNPRIKRVFESWRDTPNSTALLSNLEKNQELKAVLLQETPWVLDAKNESLSKQRIGLLFDLNRMAKEFNSALTKLQKNQSANGAWPWYAGMNDSWWVTQYIVEGFGHLDKLGVSTIRKDPKVWAMVQPAVRYIDWQILKDYNNLKQHTLLEHDNLGYMEMHYLYARSFFKDIAMEEEVKVAVQYFMDQATQYWVNKTNYGQGLLALALHRDGNTLIPKKIIASLKERALHKEEMGMWWKSDYGWFWYQAPIETQSLMIETFSELTDDTRSVDKMRTWLLKQKQTTNWKTTKATAEACYALLISGTEWLNTELLAEISIGGNKLDLGKLDGVAVEAGTGYFKTSWSGNEISPKMANITVTNPNRVPSWGALYWQYFEDLDKISPADTPLQLTKKLFIERITDTGKVLDPVSSNSQLKVGDKVVVRIELRSDRDMEYVHLKDMRSAGFEPINVISRIKWQDGLVYYEATGDTATNFFIEYLRKGTYVFEYPMWVTHLGDFSNGITSIQCLYAPEFSAHSEGIRVQVK